MSIQFVISQATGNQGSITSNDSYNNECLSEKLRGSFFFFTNKEILSKSNSLSHSLKHNLCTISVICIYSYIQCKKKKPKTNKCSKMSILM